MKKISTLFIACFVSLLAMADGNESGVKVLKSGIWYSLQGISPNGRYVCGSSLYNGAYIWDTQEGTLMWESVTSSTSEMGFYDVADNGMAVGQDNEQRPGYYENGEWHALSEQPGAAQCVVGDGLTICGNIYETGINKPYVVHPTVWTRQADGTFKKENLPNPETDWLGGPVQFNTARAISNDGRYVVGVQIEDRGRYYTCILWEKQQDGTWTYSLPFADKEFNIEEFKRLQAEEPALDDYVFVAPGQAGYFDQVRNFQRVYAEWQYELNTKGRTGLFFAMPPVVLSNTGYTLACPLSTTTWSFTPGDTDLSKESEVHPVTYDLATQEMTEYTEASGVVTYCTSESGTMLSSDGYDVFIIPHDTKKKERLDDWLMEHYGFDLWGAVPSNTGYMEEQGISADGKKIFIMYTSVTLEGELDDMQLTMIELPDTEDGVQEVKVTTHPAGKTYNLQGKAVMHPSQRGVYVINGKKVLK